MAKIETTFIRPKEVFNVDTGKAEVVYDGYQNNPHKLVVQENLDEDIKGEINEEFATNDNNNVVFKDSDNVEHELITAEGFADELNSALPQALANAQVIKTTWSELKALRDGGNLIAGSLYRITDYQCTTTQENTQSAGHQFDIVLLALSEDKLAEEGWAMEHPTDVYDVTFDDGVTVKCWILKTTNSSVPYNIVNCATNYGMQMQENEINIDEINKTAHTTDSGWYSTDFEIPNLQYSYFQNSNLSAWKVWYCLDNDTARFAWADSSVDEDRPANIKIRGNGQTGICVRNNEEDISVEDRPYYAWYMDGENIYTLTETPNSESHLFVYVGEQIIDTTEQSNFEVVSYTPAHEGTGLPNGRGVIYRLIDELFNDVGYDFKNIQFVRPMTDGDYDPEGEDTWVYTFAFALNDNGDIIDATISDGDGNTFVFCNTVNVIFELTDNVFLGATGNCYVAYNSNVNTIINGSSIILLCCGDLVCGGNEEGESAIYLNNKKVLTEE